MLQANSVTSTSDLIGLLSNSYLYKFSLPSFVDTVVVFGCSIPRYVFGDHVNVIFVAKDFEEAKQIKSVLNQGRVEYEYCVIVSSSSLPAIIDRKVDLAIIAVDGKSTNLFADFIEQINAKLASVFCIVMTIPVSFWGKLRCYLTYFIFRLKTTKYSRLLTVYHYPSLCHPMFAMIYPGLPTVSLKRLYFEFKQLLLGNNKIFILSGGNYEKSRGYLLHDIKLDIERVTGRELGEGVMVRHGTGDSAVCDFGSVIVRMPQSQRGRKRCIRNYTVLQELHELGIKNVPRAVVTGSIEGQYYYAEHKLQGISLDLIKISQARQKNIVAQAATILTSPSFIIGFFSPDNIEKILHVEIAQLMNEISCPGLSLLGEIGGFIGRLCTESRIPKVIQHGDFKKSNFLLKSRFDHRIVGVFDWDLSLIPGFPLYDMLTLVLYARGANTQTFPARVWQLANEWENDDEIREYCLQLGLNNKAVLILALMTIVRFINNVFTINQKQDKNWQESIINNCLVPFCQQVINQVKQKNVF